nr:11091_t:CDS:10 [Entrophospora candida]CAG8499899.1 1660_t:CDS:10 [Entrophospora candida]
MTGSDVRDILELPKSAGNEGVSSSKRPKPEKEKKPDGVPRELLQLIGGPPPIAFVKPALKAKPHIKQQAAHWEWKEFTNPKRNDDLKLKHWTKVTTSTEKKNNLIIDSNNNPINVEKYSDEEYNKYLIDKDWSKEETDYLFDMCKKYDLRFIVIHDRYDFPNKTRTIEDLKDRYYSACKKILQIRPMIPGNPSDKGTMIALNSYDKAKEELRKKNLCLLYRRTNEQIKEEEELLEEYERIEQNEKKFPKRKKSLLSGPPTPIVEISNSSMFYASNELATKKSRRTSASSAGSIVLEAHSPVEVLVPIISRREKFAPGVVVRSQKIPVPKQNLTVKVQKALQEFGLGIRPNMPTETVCGKWTELQKAIQNLLDLKKHADKLEHELKVSPCGGAVDKFVNVGDHKR